MISPFYLTKCFDELLPVRRVPSGENVFGRVKFNLIGCRDRCSLINLKQIVHQIEVQFWSTSRL